jgi:membrane-associated protease RseP (regulator of RpoE activity)
LFRWEEDRHAVFLVKGRPAPRPSNPWINFWLGIATILSVGFIGYLNGATGPLPSGVLPAIWSVITTAAPYAVSLLAILAAHEFGHYLVARYHGVHVTLPYFIPMPFPPFGTMGAVINMKEQPKNRKVLLDIGLAGPFAGLLVAIPVLLIGLSLSQLSRLPLGPGPDGSPTFSLEGNSLLYLFVKYLRFGQLLPAPSSYHGVAPVLYWLRFFFTGHPIPYGGLDVNIHPVAWAGWVGLLVTMLNLIPAGQLDGGHALYVLVGRKGAQRVFPFILVFLVVMGFVSLNWWLWAGLVFLLGRYYAEPMDEITPLDGRRKLLAALAIVLFVILFTPVLLQLA